MKRYLLQIFSILGCFLAQSTLFHAISFGGIVPNLLMIVTAAYGFMYGRKSGMCTGFFCGLLMDTFFGNTLGFYTLLYVYAGYMNGYFSKIFFPEDMRLPLMLIAISDLLYNFVCYGLLFLLRRRFNVGYYVSNIILPEMVYTMVISLVMYPLLLRADRHFLDEEIRAQYKKSSESSRVS